MQQSLDELKNLDRKVKRMEKIAALASWDQQTYMPGRAAEERSEQLALLGSMIHDMTISPKMGQLLASLGADDANPGGAEELSDLDRAFVREAYRRFRKATKLPGDLVEEMAREKSLAQAVWVEARKSNRFDEFAPSLKKVIALTHRAAEHLGYDDHIYDALLDDYEPGMRTAEVQEVFADLGRRLADLSARIGESEQVRTDFLSRSYPVEKQEQFAKEVLEAIGFDTDRGRLDVSAHPFTTTLGQHDVRLTTRYDDTCFETSLFGTIHEAGHGMYEQGFAEEIQGMILGDAASFGIHESQSRFWENVVGKSRPFWERFYPRLREFFPDQLNDVPLEVFYKGINRVEPSFIRVEADEVTYSLHIILRFELEKALMSGDIGIMDLPSAWNSRMKELLGVVPENDRDGVLQDIHWSAGYIGYFPTYALGNLYGAQFSHTMGEEISGLDDKIASGDFNAILEWQRRHIHSPGKTYSAGELCRLVTGERLNASYFMEHLNHKYKDIYGL